VRGKGRERLVLSFWLDDELEVGGAEESRDGRDMRTLELVRWGEG
jgi:hypothetical protein